MRRFAKKLAIAASLSPVTRMRASAARRYFTALVWCAALIAGVSAEAGYTTIWNNGESNNRVDLVFMGDGYTASQIGTVYPTHIDAMLEHMFSGPDPTFNRYRNFFNVHRIDVVSAESGADVPPLNIFRNTALDAKYYFDGVTERLLGVSPVKAAQTEVTNLAGAPFSAEMRLVTVNDTRYGGSGGPYATYAGGNASATEVALHELGHSFAGLADEYGGNTTTYTGAEPSQPNVTKDPTGAKWAHWLGYNQPGIGVIGAYEGARYYDRGLYRPSLDSKMRSLDRPFDAVSREQIVLDIYEFVDPLDDWRDNVAPLDGSEPLWVTPVDTDVIEVSWSVDGVEVASGTSLSLADLNYGPGTYSVEARAFDPTDWVRIAPELLSQSIVWTVTIADLPPSIVGDANGDCTVGAADYAIWAAQFGQTGANLSADFDAGGSVGAGDYTLWAANFGNTCAPAASVPETGTALLMGIGLLGLLGLHRHRFH